MAASDERGGDAEPAALCLEARRGRGEGRRCWTSAEEDFLGSLGAVFMIVYAHLGLLIGIAAGAEAAGKPLASARQWLRRGAVAGEQRCLGPQVRRMPRKVGRRRYRRPRRPKGAPQRPRAWCRRAEAYWLAYLVLSVHALPAGSGTQGYMDAKLGHRFGGLGPGPRDVRVERTQTPACGALCGSACGRALGGATAWHCRWHDANWWTTTTRFGEALHPGPLEATVLAHGLLRRTFAAARRAISYPTPGSHSLRGAIAPGYPATRAHDTFALKVESVNTTGWKALQRRLTATSAHVVLAQETWLTPDAIHAASAWAKRNGWHSIWSAAVPGPCGGASGGTAIFARDFLGLRYPPGGSHEWVPGRAVAAVLDAPAMRPILLVSCYLVHGIGPAPANLSILAEIGRRKRAAADEYEMFMGGDVNMEPPDFAATGFAEQMDAAVLYPSTGRGTFRTARSASLIDYFVVSSRTAAAVQRVEAIEASGVKGHTPVQATFRPEVTTLRALHLRKPPRLGSERVVGPIPPPPTGQQRGAPPKWPWTRPDASGPMRSTSSITRTACGPIPPKRRSPIILASSPRRLASAAFCHGSCGGRLSPRPRPSPSPHLLRPPRGLDQSPPS